MSFYRCAVRQRAEKSMRVSVDQDYVIRTKLRWYDLLDHIICLSVPHLLYGAMQGCSCGSPQGPRAGYAQIDRCFDYSRRAINRSISLAGSLSLFFYHDSKYFSLKFFGLLAEYIRNVKKVFLIYFTLNIYIYCLR